MRLEFTVLGETVNVAARLEQATKAHGVPILVPEAARRATGPGAGEWREVSRALLRGRLEAMAYYTPEEPNEPAGLGVPVPQLANASA